MLAMRIRLRIGPRTARLNLRHEQRIAIYISKNKIPAQVSRVGALLKVIVNIYDDTLCCHTIGERMKTCNLWLDRSNNCGKVVVLNSQSINTSSDTSSATNRDAGPRTSNTIVNASGHRAWYNDVQSCFFCAFANNS